MGWKDGKLTSLSSLDVVERNEVDVEKQSRRVGMRMRVCKCGI